MVDIDYSESGMFRIVAFALFALSVRIFSAPSLCTHPVMDSSISEIQVPVMTHCHRHMVAAKKDAPKHAPCNHMKKCLLDAGNEDSMIQKSFDITSIAGCVHFVVYVPAWSENLPLVNSETVIFNRPPPGALHSRTAVYISKSSLLI